MIADNRKKDINGSMGEIWTRYKKSQKGNLNSEGDLKLRNLILKHYTAQVDYHARNIHSKLPPEVDIKDLKQAGIIGLIETIRRYELEKEVKFEFYASRRIRGAIFDELRQRDWAPRGVRKRASKVESIKEDLNMGHKIPTKNEIKSYLENEKNEKIDEKELERLMRDITPIRVYSLDRELCKTNSSKNLRNVDFIPDKNQPNPEIEAQKTDLKNKLTKGFSRNERLIINLYYYANMTLEEIGKILDLTESRISQIHSSLIDRLRVKFENRKEEFKF